MKTITFPRVLPKLPPLPKKVQVPLLILAVVAVAVQLFSGRRLV